MDTRDFQYQVFGNILKVMGLLVFIVALIVAIFFGNYGASLFAWGIFTVIYIAHNFLYFRRLRLDDIDNRNTYIGPFVVLVIVNFGLVIFLRLSFFPNTIINYLSDEMFGILLTAFVGYLSIAYPASTQRSSLARDRELKTFDQIIETLNKNMAISTKKELTVENFKDDVEEDLVGYIADLVSRVKTLEKGLAEVLKILKSELAKEREAMFAQAVRHLTVVAGPVTTVLVLSFLRR